MRPLEDSSSLESELRRTLIRPSAPSNLCSRVMTRMHAESITTAATVPARRSFFRLPRRKRTSWALAAVACAGAIFVALAVPGWQERRSAERYAMQTAEQDLAEALHLASAKWNLAQQAAFSPTEDNDHESF